MVGNEPRLAKNCFLIFQKMILKKPQRSFPAWLSNMSLFKMDLIMIFYDPVFKTGTQKFFISGQVFSNNQKITL